MPAVSDTERAELERRNLTTAFATLDAWLVRHGGLPPLDWHVDRGLTATADLDDYRARKMIDTPVEPIVTAYAAALGAEVERTPAERGELWATSGRIGDEDDPRTWITLRVIGTVGTTFADWVLDGRLRNL